MRYKLTALFFLLSYASSIPGQQQNPNKRPEYVIVPPENVLLVTASQPDSPIEIRSSTLLNPLDGSRRAAFQYEVRNRGKKPIKYISVFMLDSAGTGSGPLYNGHVLNKPLLPGQKLLLGAQSPEIVTLTPELRERLKLTGPLRVVVVLLIDKVKYTDGSVFEGTTAVKALDDYFIDINSEEINLRANPAPAATPRE